MNETQRIAGIHHVTAITSDGQENIDFYCGVLGLRLVKVTVNYDDPQSYHLYYGDALGRPGTIMTFFVWSGASRGRQGLAQVSATAFATPLGALDFWSQRLADAATPVQATFERFGDQVLQFEDPDGLCLEIVATDEGEWPDPRPAGPVPAEHALRGFHGVTLSEEGYERTAELLTEIFGFKPLGNDGNRFRFAGSKATAQIVDVLCVPGGRRGKLGAGVVHHVAFRADDDEAQQMWRQRLADERHNVTPVIDRNYFRSIYFREPGGVLFEIATDQLGFTKDEPAEALGSALKLPPMLEPMRSAIESALPPLRLPGRTGSSSLRTQL